MSLLWLDGWGIRGWVALVLGAGAVVTGLCACSSSSSSNGANAGCAANPAQCATGTTCWPADTVPTMKCLPSDPNNGFGAACAQLPGKATCADGLACDQTSAVQGSCTYYCSSGGQTCPAGYACFTTHVGSANGPAVDICRPEGLPGGDGGLPLDDGSIYEASIWVDGACGPSEGGSEGGPPM